VKKGWSIGPSLQVVSVSELIETIKAFENEYL
jgi:hypothetical protein